MYSFRLLTSLRADLADQLQTSARPLRLLPQLRPDPTSVRLNSSEGTQRAAMIIRTAMASSVVCLAAAWVLQLAVPAAAAVPDTVTAAPALRTNRLMTAGAADLVPEANFANIRGRLEEDGFSLASPLFTDGRKYTIELVTDTVGTCPSKTETKSMYMVVRYYKGGDSRDSASGYVYGSTADKGISSYMMEYHKEEKAYKIRHAIKASNYGDKWYLAVHDFYSDDSIPNGDFRVIAHADPNKAVLWDVWKKDSSTFMFTVKKNLAFPGLAEGMSLGTPPTQYNSYVKRKSDGTQYLAVVHDLKCTALTKVYKY